MTVLQLINLLVDPLFKVLTNVSFIQGEKNTTKIYIEINDSHFIFKE